MSSEAARQAGSLPRASRLVSLPLKRRVLRRVEDNRSYRRRYSLDAIRRDAARELGDELLIPTSGVIWQRLKTLFTSIDKGSKPLNVTTFNGGLFDPGQDEYHAFLERYTVGDLSLGRAIDKLARVNEQFIDYRDLAERHLGTIYEGLLEYTLQVATEPMAELRSSSKIVPAQGVPARDIARTYDSGRVYLVTDRGERKITGSYYTPDYVVKYMVEQTLGPVLSEATAVLGTSPNDAEKIRAVLAVNVLDPSMGSGHFPVEVMEYIARYLVELGVQADETSESDLTYWKRRVAQQCIYGVDLNPLAVELAKLSLWLATAAKDRPLNFLDHHLRPGNALAGSWLKDVAAGQHPGAKQAQRKAQEALEAEKAAGQLSLLEDEEFRQEVGAALDVMSTIEQNPGITVENVKAQEAAYEQLRQRFTGRYLYLANLGAALYYNIEVGEDVWRLLANYALGKTDNYTPEMEARFTALLEQATKLSTGGKRFFLWELEFPDIFYDHNGQPLGDKAGFDVVIGNPPYVRQEKLQEDKPFFQEHYEVYHGVADLFVYFFAQGLNLLRQGGRLAYISSNAWLRANYATSLRHYLRTQTTVETIVDLGNNRVFADAPDLTPSIQIVRKTPPAGEHLAYAAIFARGEPVKTFTEQLATKLFALSIHDQLDTGWQLTSTASRALAAKLLETGRPLGEVVQGRIYYGVKTGLNEAFFIDQATRDRLVKDDPTCMAIIKPVLRGEDLRPWYQEDEGRWLIFTRRGIDIDAYPAVKAYLQQFREQLEPRPIGWDNSLHWPGRKPGPYKWYEIQDTIEYYQEFENPKILWPDIARFPRFSLDESWQFSNDTTFFLLSTDVSLLGILQSRACWFCITRLCAPLGERTGLMIYRLKTQYMEHLPIPSLMKEQHDHIGTLAQQITEKAKQRYEVRRRTTHRIESDLGTTDRKPNQQLAEWWELPFKEFREEVVKSFKHDISVKDRDEWETLLRERTAEIEKLTGEIVRLEMELNAAVYEAFGLNEAEIALIERETKYLYGEW
jgi:type I restriction-modification system DNA methylase subunit